MLLWMDSFDKYGSGSGGTTKMLDGLYASIFNGGFGLPQPVNTQVRTGLYSMQVFNQGGFRRVFGAHKTTVGCAQACFFSALPTATDRIMLFSFLNDAAQAIATLTLDSTGQVSIRTGTNNGTIRATSAPVIVATAWQHVEIKITFSATVGTCEVRVNGTTVINATAINTDAIGGGYASQVLVESFDPVLYYVDDFFAWDTTGSYNNDFIGDMKVYALYPSADTAVADWIPDTGTVGYSRINEATPNDANYIEGDNAGDVSEFEFDNLPSNVINVAAVQTSTRMLKTDAGTNDVQMAMVSGASAANGTNRPITTNATYYSDVYEEDPDTSSAWTRPGVNAALVRATRTA